MSGPAEGQAASGRPCWWERSGPVLALCLALAALAHGASVLDGFYNDDALFLNQATRVLSNPLALFTERPLGYFRPAWSAYVTLQRMVFGLAPAGYHVVGVLLHGLTGFLVWKLARRVLAGRGVGGAGGKPDGAATGRQDPVPPLFAAAAFLCFFAHAEGVLWIAAHNSVLACMLCVAACLAHLNAVERGGIGRGLLSAAIALLALLTKEPSAVLLAWLPCCEMAVFGWRSAFTRAAWGRWAALAAGVATFVALNARVGQAFSSADALAGGETRAAIAFVTVHRALGAAAWMFSPVAHTEASVHAGWGLLALALAFLPVLLRRRDLLPAALFGAVLLLTAIVPASMTRFQQANGSRLYYFPTVGAALLLGTFVAALGTRRTPVLVLVAAAIFLGANVWADWRLDRTDYRPISVVQTRLAGQLGTAIAQAGKRPLLLVEPWIDNLMHFQEFAMLYTGLKPGHVTRLNVAREQGPTWLAAQRRAGALVLDWDDERGLVPATGMPPARNSAPGAPRGADAVELSPRVQVIRIAPP